jgi:hypothetical protein
MANGVAFGHRDKVVFCLGSDGSQQEGNDAEAARIAVANGLNIKLIIDDNDVTISGHPSEYLGGFDIKKTLAGHGLKVFGAQGEDFEAVWGGICDVVGHEGPAACKTHHFLRNCRLYRLLSSSGLETRNGPRSPRRRRYRLSPRCHSRQVCLEIS